MAASPALSPRPNPPGPGARPSNLNPKSKGLALLHANRSPATTKASTPNDTGVDLAEQMNDDVREQYVQGKKLGEGTYANVYKGHYRHDPTSLVAIKKIKINADYKDGIAMDAVREIKFLSELSHPYIIKLHNVFSTKDQNISLVLEHLPCGDLEALWKNPTLSYSTAEIKAWASMLCQAVWFCHENSVLHRDIKGNNILIAGDGSIKLADFGLARSFADPGRPMTYNVITRFYRPPELLYGARHYSSVVDIWSCGVVIAELAIRQFLFPSETDIQALSLIYELCGTPIEDNWPGVTKLEFYVPPTQTFTNGVSNAAKRAQPISVWKQRFSLLGDEGVDLLRGMLMLDPKRRLDARKVLAHRYWKALPRPTPREKLPKAGGGEEKMGEDLKRKGIGGEGEGRADKVARKLDFSSMRK
ncbi:serine/threonine-protein kinase-like protein [Amniculicola lignicola CBS 123094]|uniref:Serine/threonine-protein kinase-like protein n=1 Tax=Amniculicola lignicola CBS 123094 TaxID=1392246 RepID=A0A6A5X0Q9_9PLEO|nr:serine/threonine-protein kinase-like protein [Amniculicola lignicola CBS 123094]